MDWSEKLQFLNYEISEDGIVFINVRGYVPQIGSADHHIYFSMDDKYAKEFFASMLFAINGNFDIRVKPDENGELLLDGIEKIKAIRVI